MDDKQKADEFLKDIDLVSQKHGLHLGISQPQFIIQPIHGKPKESTLDIEKLSVQELESMADKYQSVVDKSVINVQVIKAEIAKRSSNIK